MYITQHAEDRNRGSAYVKELTHMIGKQLLEEIKERCPPEEDGSNRNLNKHYDTDHNRPNNVNEHTKSNCPARSKPSKSKKHTKSNNINLKLRSTPNGQVRIVWDGIIVEMLKWEMKIGIYKDEDEDNTLVEYPLNGRAHGEIDTHLALNCGLRLCLLKPITIFETVYESSECDYIESKRDRTVPWEAGDVSYSFFTFRNLFSLVFSPFSHLFSLVHFTVSNLFSLVFFIFNNLFSLLHFICQEILFAVGKLISLVFSAFFQVVLVLLSCMLIDIGGSVIVDVADDRPRAAPPFVVVSHGRPGF